MIFTTFRFGSISMQIFIKPNRFKIVHLCFYWCCCFGHFWGVLAFCLLSQTDRKFIVENICSFIENQAIFPWSNVMRAEWVQIKHGIYEKVIHVIIEMCIEYAEVYECKHFFFLQKLSCAVFAHLLYYSTQNDCLTHPPLLRCVIHIALYNRLNVGLLLDKHSSCACVSFVFIALIESSHNTTSRLDFNFTSCNTQNIHC